MKLLVSHPHPHLLFRNYCGWGLGTALALMGAKGPVSTRAVSYSHSGDDACSNLEAVHGTTEERAGPGSGPSPLGSGAANRASWAERREGARLSERCKKTGTVVTDRTPAVYPNDSEEDSGRSEGTDLPGTGGDRDGNMDSTGH